MKGFTSAGRHNYYDIGLIMESKSIQPPAKKKIKVDIPFMDGSYDFSTIGSNGEIVYTERTITVILGLPTRSKELLHVFYSRALEWLQDISGKQQLVFDDIPDYYFMAEVEGVSSFEEMRRFGKLTVTFTAEPFKTGINLEGSDIWNTFNLEQDVAQDVGFDVVGTKAVTIINVGRVVSPTINVNAEMSIVFSGVTYNLAIGNNKFYGFKLLSGDNPMVINGTGHVSFAFRKVMI